jgi:ssDNA-binding Zn-finger/Zn-ribbon topoisomerase 1
MSILDSLFSGAKVFVKQFVTVLGDAVRVVLEEIDRSPFGKAAAGLVHGFTRKYFSQAEDLAAEEREFAEKFKRDGKRTEQDEERLREMQAERERLRKEMEAAKAREAAEEFKSDSDEVIAAEMTDDELSSAVGILASKQCPDCGGTMRIRQGAFNVATEKRNFYWQCTMTNRLPCPIIKLNADDLKASVLRKENPDLDGDAKARKQIWTKDDVSNKAHGRLRQNHLGENDEEVVCPHHLLPMKLIQKGGNDGRMLSSYEYVCMAVHPDGRACAYTVGLETYPQVAAMLRRREGKGIIDG